MTARPTSASREHGGFEVEVIDLRDWELPILCETFATVGDPRNPVFSAPAVKRWNEKIAEGDAYLFITPEYNHSVPGVLKNAIDSVFATFAFRTKPAACVAYSGGIAGGVRAIEHLAQIAIEAEMVPLRNNVVIPFIGPAAGQVTGNIAAGDHAPDGRSGMSVGATLLAGQAAARTPTRRPTVRRPGDVPT
jgi:NAD(P)H-dependent FMN reductase